MKLKTIYEALGRCDACQHRPKSVDDLRRVPEIPTLHFCSRCWPNRIAILIRAQRLMRESITDDDYHWKDVFQKMGPHDVSELKRILASKREYWDDAELARDWHGGEEDWSPLDPEDMSASVDQHNQKVKQDQKIVQIQQELAQLKQENERLTRKREKALYKEQQSLEQVFEKLAQSIRYRYPAHFGDKLLEPHIKIKGGALHIKPFEYSFRERPYLVILRNHFNPEMIKVTERFTNSLYTISKKDPKILQKLRRFVFAWLRKIGLERPEV